MSDLTEYDREIVAAAEAIDRLPIPAANEGAAFQRLANAVHAKREAKRESDHPWCESPGCGSRAVQRFTLHPGSSGNFRCDEHRIEVREL